MCFRDLCPRVVRVPSGKDVVRVPSGKDALGAVLVSVAGAVCCGLLWFVVAGWYLRGRPALATIAALAAVFRSFRPWAVLGVSFQ